MCLTDLDRYQRELQRVCDAPDRVCLTVEANTRLSLHRGIQPEQFRAPFPDSQQPVEDEAHMLALFGVSSIDHRHTAAWWS
jgi:hypothetical protein